ncbi:MAG: 7-carboxy-7-deazaguanine synthase QueE [Planctomycetota bacterium]
MDLESALKKLRPGAGAAPAADQLAAKPGARAPLVEIFHSIQGEGRFVGVPMTFLRVATCPLRCLYCDTPNSYTAPARVPVRLSVRELLEPNPVAAARAAELVRQVGAAGEPGRKSGSLSVTGGEPLVFPEFLRELGRIVRGHGMRVHLETAAVHPDALALCVDQVDHLSADYKLPETLGAPVEPALALAPGTSYGVLHRRCCELALRRGASVDVKVVLTDRVGDASLEQALADLQPVRDKIVLVLQPVTPFGAVTRTVARDDLRRFVDTAVRAQFQVRVLPQVHKVLQVP